MHNIAKNGLNSVSIFCQLCEIVSMYQNYIDIIFYKEIVFIFILQISFYPIIFYMKKYHTTQKNIYVDHHFPLGTYLTPPQKSFLEMHAIGSLKTCIFYIVRVGGGLVADLLLGNQSIEKIMNKEMQYCSRMRNCRRLQQCDAFTPTLTQVF